MIGDCTQISERLGRRAAGSAAAEPYTGGGLIAQAAATGRHFEARLGDLQRRHHAIQLAWLLTHDAGAAEDIVQDAFTAVFHRFATLELPVAYLRRTIVNGV